MCSANFLPIDHMSASPTDGIGSTTFEGREFRFHRGQSFPLSLCGPNSIGRANAHIFYGKKISTAHYILSFTLFTIQSHEIDKLAGMSNRRIILNFLYFRFRTCRGCGSPS